MTWRRREREDQKLDAELRDHLERLTADYVARGWSEAEARRQARLEFGGLEQIKEATRDVHRRKMLDEIQRDVGHAIRLLTRNRGFASIAVLTLAIGIGANTAVFSVLDTIALRPLPVREPGELVEFLTRLDGPRSSGSPGTCTSDIETAIRSSRISSARRRRLYVSVPAQNRRGPSSSAAIFSPHSAFSPRSDDFFEPRMIARQAMPQPWS